MEELKQKLTEVINGCQLPFEAIFYVVKDVYRDVNDIYIEMLKKKEVQKEENNIEENPIKDEAEQTK